VPMVVRAVGKRRCGRKPPVVLLFANGGCTAVIATATKWYSSLRLLDVDFKPLRHASYSLLLHYTVTVSDNSVPP